MWIAHTHTRRTYEEEEEREEKKSKKLKRSLNLYSHNAWIVHLIMAQKKRQPTKPMNITERKLHTRFPHVYSWFYIISVCSIIIALNLKKSVLDAMQCNSVCAHEAMTALYHFMAAHNARLYFVAAFFVDFFSFHFDLAMHTFTVQAINNSSV